MGELLGVDTTHVPYLMSAPENVLRFRRMLCGMAEARFQKTFVDPQEALPESGRDLEVVVRAAVASALLDACTHRGAEMCRERSGNANRFECPYHGTVSRNDGRQLGDAALDELERSGVLRADAGGAEEKR